MTQLEVLRTCVNREMAVHLTNAASLQLTVLETSSRRSVSVELYRDVDAVDQLAVGVEEGDGQGC